MWNMARRNQDFTIPAPPTAPIDMQMIGFERQIRPREKNTVYSIVVEDITCAPEIIVG